MRKNIQVRGVDEYTWKQFQLKCQKTFKKQWGHLPNEDSPKQSGPAYVLGELMTMFVEGKVCVHADLHDKKTLIINDTVRALLHEQTLPRAKGGGPFTKDEMYVALRKNSMCHARKYLGQRTLDEYSDIIIDTYCTRIPPRLYRNNDELFVLSSEKMREHADVFPDIMFR